MVVTPPCLASALAIIVQCLPRVRGRWAALLLGLVLSLPAGGMAFEVIDMATVFPGAVNTRVYGINNAHTIVGAFDDASGSHGFVRVGLLISKIDVPGATGTVAVGINNQDPPQILGGFRDASGDHGFVCVYPCSGSAIVPVDFPNAFGTNVHGINDAGVIVGSFTGGASGISGLHGFESLGPFLATPAPQRFLIQWDLPGSTSGTVLYGINNANTLVGSFTAAGKTIAFWKTVSGPFTQLDVSELDPAVAESADAHGIDNDVFDLGTLIVGSYVDSLGQSHGWLAKPQGVRRSITRDVPVAGARGTQLIGVNDYFEAVGGFFDKNGVLHGFIFNLLVDTAAD